MGACLKLLAGSADANADRQTFLLTQFAFWLLAATDGHAKNCSVFLAKQDVYSMTPLYDVLSVWPYIGDAPHQFRRKSAGLAMAVRAKSAHYALQTIQARHWEALAIKNGGASVWQAMCQLACKVGPALEAVKGRLPAAFAVRTFDAVAAGMGAQVQPFDRGR